MSVAERTQPPVIEPPDSKSRESLRLALNLALFYAGWFACVFGLAWRQPLLGPLSAVAIVGIHLALRRDRKAEAVTIAAIAVLGPTIDAMLVHLGAVTFLNEPMMFGILAPPTLFALWAIFATTFDGALAWLANRPLIAGALTAVGIVPTYYGAERLEALTLNGNPWAWLVPVVLIWAIGFPVLLRISGRVRRIALTPPLPN